MKIRITPATEDEISAFMRKAEVQGFDEPPPGTRKLQGWGDLISDLERSRHATHRSRRRT